MMSLKFNLSALTRKSDVLRFRIDILMLALIVINLAFIVFDWHFQFEFFQNFLQRLSPSFYAYYRDVIHPDFLLYDLFFVALYVIELVTSWAIAVKKKTYHKWYFYPLVHWYDVLGCIPVGSFRWLRILRVFSILIRLHKLQAVDLTQTYLFKEAAGFYKIIMEEISDRVVIKILNGVEKEIKLDSPVTSRMILQVLEPHQETIARWISHRIRHMVEHNYELHKDDLKNYIEESIGDAVKQNREIRKINSIPLVGRQITDGLEHGISNITYEAINGLVKGISSEKNTKVIEDAIHAMFESMLMKEPDENLNRIVKDIFIRAIEMVKEQVNVKRWKQEGRAEAA